MILPLSEQAVMEFLASVSKRKRKVSSGVYPVHLPSLCWQTCRNIWRYISVDFWFLCWFQATQKLDNWSRLEKCPYTRESSWLHLMVIFFWRIVQEVKKWRNVWKQLLCWCIFVIMLKFDCSVNLCRKYNV